MFSPGARGAGVMRVPLKMVGSMIEVYIMYISCLDLTAVYVLNTHRAPRTAEDLRLHRFLRIQQRPGWRLGSWVWSAESFLSLTPAHQPAQHVIVTCLLGGDKASSKGAPHLKLRTSGSHAVDNSVDCMTVKWKRKGSFQSQQVVPWHTRTVRLRNSMMRATM